MWRSKSLINLYFEWSPSSPILISETIGTLFHVVGCIYLGGGNIIYLFCWLEVWGFFIEGVWIFDLPVINALYILGVWVLSIISFLEVDYLEGFYYLKSGVYLIIAFGYGINISLFFLLLDLTESLADDFYFPSRGAVVLVLKSKFIWKIESVVSSKGPWGEVFKKELPP